MIIADAAIGLPTFTFKLPEYFQARRVRKMLRLAKEAVVRSYLSA